MKFTQRIFLIIIASISTLGVAKDAIMPDVAKIQLANSDAEDSSLCYGVPHQNNWVITVAHCVEHFLPEELSIVFQGNRNTEIAVEQIILHPNWESKRLLHDIALIKVGQATATETFSLVQKSEQEFLEFEQDIVSLHQLDGFRDFQLMDVDACNLDLDDAWKRQGIVTSDEHLQVGTFCARSLQPELSTCFGDSGSPLVSFANGHWRLHGLVSWSYGCHETQFHSVFTRISDYSSWIESTINGLVVPFQFHMGIIPEFYASRQTITVYNFSEQFKVFDAQLSGKDASLIHIVDNQCAEGVTTDGACEVIVELRPEKTGFLTATLLMNDGESIYETVLTAIVLKHSERSYSNANDIRWFESDDAGELTHQKQYVLGIVKGAGSVSFDVNALTEKNCVADECMAAKVFANNRLVTPRVDALNYSRYSIVYAKDTLHTLLLSKGSQHTLSSVEWSPIQTKNVDNETSSKTDTSVASQPSAGALLMGLLLLPWVRRKRYSK